MTLTIKSVKANYQKILNVFIAVDLSSNKFKGEIPNSIGSLKGLQSPNLSNNDLIEPLSKRCGDRGTTPPLTIEQGDDSKFPSGVDWVVICLGLGSGLVAGLISGLILAIRNHEWFVEKFGMKKANGRR
ncbi:hypothetical protein LguiB_005814 [Lonicera macranthoides]